MSLGLCVSPRYLPDADELAALRPAGLASILYRLDDLEALFARSDRGVVSLNNECAEVRGDWSGWEDACRLIAERYAGRDLAVCCGHELDLFWSRNPADVPPEFAAYLATTAGRILRPAGIRVVLTPVAGPKWPEYLKRAVSLCREHLDAVAADFYGQIPDGWSGWGFGMLADAVATASALAGDLPVYLREYGREAADCGGEDGQAAYLRLADETIRRLSDTVPFAAWFSWHENLGKPDERGPRSLGLVRADGSRTPAWHAFAEVNARPAPKPEPEPEPKPEPEPAMPETLSREQIVAVVREVADEVGIPRLLLLACGIAESNLDQLARRPTDPARDREFWPDVSPGVFQQTIRYAPEYLRWCAVDAPHHDPNAYPGLDVVRAVEAHYWDVRHAAKVAAAQLKGKYRPAEADATFKALNRYNWPAGEGSPYTADHAANYRRGIAEATAILNADAPTEPTAPAYDPSHPARPQEETFDCSQESLEWAFWAYGRTTSDDWLESAMIAEGVMTARYGLMDASGAGLAAFVRRHYAELGYTADHADPVTFDDVAAEAGWYPLLIGGRAWNHWSGCRSYDAGRDVLLLANPADGHKGVRQEMTRQQFAALGPFSIVRVRHESAPDPGGDVGDPRDARIAELEREREGLVTALAEACDVEGDKVAAVAARLRELREQFVGPRPAA